MTPQTPYIYNGFMVHAECKVPGMWSKVVSRTQEDGSVWVWHVIIDDFEERAIFQSKTDAGMVEAMRLHRDATDTWLDMFLASGATFAEFCDQHMRHQVVSA